jgi:hypothetical protein
MIVVASEHVPLVRVKGGVPDELINLALKKSVEFLRSDELNKVIDDYFNEHPKIDFFDAKIKISFNITTKRKNHICLCIQFIPMPNLPNPFKVDDLAKCYTLEIVKPFDIDYYVFDKL